MEEKKKCDLASKTCDWIVCEPGRCARARWRTGAQSSNSARASEAAPAETVDQRLFVRGVETNHDDPIASVCPTRIMSETREKRERKATVEVYTVDSPTKKEFVIAEGKGTKLGDIPNRACQQSHF